MIIKNVRKKIFLHTLSENSSVNLMNQRWQRGRIVEKYISYCSSLTKLWTPSLPAAILNEIVTITAGKPAMQCKRKTKVKESISLDHSDQFIHSAKQVQREIAVK